MKSRQKAFTSLCVSLFFSRSFYRMKKIPQEMPATRTIYPTQFSRRFSFDCIDDKFSCFESPTCFFRFEKRKFIDNHDEKKKFNQWNWYRFGEHRFGGRKETREIIFPFMDLSCASSCRPFPPQQWTRNRYFEINEIRFASICQFVNWESENIFRSDDGERKCAIKYPWL